MRAASPFGVPHCRDLLYCEKEDPSHGGHGKCIVGWSSVTPDAVGEAHRVTSRSVTVVGSAGLAMPLGRLVASEDVGDYMSRKRPSFHTKEQFAVFLERMQVPLDSESDSKFSQAVAKLIRNGNPGPQTDANARIPPPPAAGAEDLETTRVTARKAEPGRDRLPPKPDFEAIESAARDTVQARTALLTLLGDLVLSWSNNESLLIYVLMILLETDEQSAAITFATLNTTRARMDLVHRLLLLKVRDRAIRSSVEGVMDRFSEANKVRNELIHAMYSVSAGGEITHTHLMRFVEKRGEISFGDRQAMDRKRLDSIGQTCAELKRLNRDLWDLLPRLQASVGQHGATGRSSQ